MFLQLGLSFIVPFLNIPFGGGSSSSSLFGSQLNNYESNEYGSNNYGQNNYGANNYGSNSYGTTPSYGTTSSVGLGINAGSIIFAVILGLAAIILIPLFVSAFTGDVNTSPFGRSKC